VTLTICLVVVDVHDTRSSSDSVQFLWPNCRVSNVVNNRSNSSVCVVAYGVTSITLTHTT
jgi:hypothetical protein